MTEISDATFRNAMMLIADIAPYKHVKDAIRDANNLAPYLKDEPGVFKDEDDIPSEKALSELRDKLTGDDDNRPRTPHYAPVGGFENLPAPVKDKAKSLAALRESEEVLGKINWPCPSCQWHSSLFPQGKDRFNSVRVHIMQLCKNFSIEYPQEFAKFKEMHH